MTGDNEIILMLLLKNMVSNSMHYKKKMERKETHKLSVFRTKDIKKFLGIRSFVSLYFNPYLARVLVLAWKANVLYPLIPLKIMVGQ